MLLCTCYKLTYLIVPCIIREYCWFDQLKYLLFFHLFVNCKFWSVRNEAVEFDIGAVIVAQSYVCEFLYKDVAIWDVAYERSRYT